MQQCNVLVCANMRLGRKKNHNVFSTLVKALKVSKLNTPSQALPPDFDVINIVKQSYKDILWVYTTAPLLRLF